MNTNPTIITPVNQGNNPIPNSSGGLIGKLASRTAKFFNEPGKYEILRKITLIVAAVFLSATVVGLLIVVPIAMEWRRQALSQTPLSNLPDELIGEILLSSNKLESLGRVAQLNKKFCQLVNNDHLWRSVATRENISLQKAVPVKEQVKESFSIRNKITKLPEYQDNTTNLVYSTQKQIEDLGGICLTANQSTFNDDQYHGIVLLAENTEEGKKNFLHIAPGGGYCDFSKEDFTRIMPEAIKKLDELRIAPDYFVVGGRHPGDTAKNFLSWQSGQGKM